MKKIKYVFKLFALVALLFIASIMIIYPEKYVLVCFNGFLMWAECVLPALFPFGVIALILIKTQVAQKAALPLKKAAKILNMPEIFGVCLVISLCSGYPVGSRIIDEFYDSGEISKNDAQKLSYLASTSSPTFIVGTVGAKLFKNKIIGLAIFGSHALSVIAVSLVISLFSSPTTNREERKIYAPNKNILYDCFYSAVISVCVAGGFIAFFSCVGQICQDFYILEPIKLILSPVLGNDVALSFCSGLVEVTTGCAKLAATGKTIAIPLSGFLITFGGGCIILQQLSYLTKAKVNAVKFIAVKAIQAILCAVLLIFAVV